MASKIRSLLWLTVSMTTGIEGVRFRIARVHSMPFIPGSARSMRITRGRSFPSFKA
jgi:hypothetical protein